MFREYIIAFARLVDVDLTGDPIVLGNNGAKLIFQWWMEKPFFPI